MSSDDHAHDHDRRVDPTRLDASHDPGLESWVESANLADTDFPIQNLPFGIFSEGASETATGNEAASRRRVGVAIGDQVLDVSRCRELPLFAGPARAVVELCDRPTLAPIMALAPRALDAFRGAVSQLLDRRLRDDDARACAEAALLARSAVALHLPAAVGDYTDFYCSIHHATNVGSMFRPDNPLLPNYKHIPIGYHGRASSLVPSGTPVRRPSGQTKAPDAELPSFGPTRLLDYELEVGAFVGTGNRQGEPIPLAEAESHLFGLVLVNDWSARDVQAWEYQPLGPFLAKSFATTVSPWVITRQALAPFRVPAFERPADDPRPLPHLDSEDNRRHGGFDLTLEVHLSSAAMRQRGMEPVRLSRGSFRHLYWTLAQMLTHHASNGCNLRAGDLLASGTVSGPEKSERGCLLELTWRGAEPLELPSGETRRFLEDGDEVSFRGRCERPGAVAIGFGDCRGTVLPAG